MRALFIYIKMRVVPFGVVAQRRKPYPPHSGRYTHPLLPRKDAYRPPSPLHTEVLERAPTATTMINPAKIFYFTSSMACLRRPWNEFAAVQIRFPSRAYVHATSTMHRNENSSETDLVKKWTTFYLPTPCFANFTRR